MIKPIYKLWIFFNPGTVLPTHGLLTVSFLNSHACFVLLLASCYLISFRRPWNSCLLPVVWTPSTEEEYCLSWLFASRASGQSVSIDYRHVFLQFFLFEIFRAGFPGQKTGNSFGNKKCGPSELQDNAIWSWYVVLSFVTIRCGGDLCIIDSDHKSIFKYLIGSFK